MAKQDQWFEVGYGLVDVPADVTSYEVIGHCAHGHAMYRDPMSPDCAYDLGCDVVLVLQRPLTLHESQAAALYRYSHRVTQANTSVAAQMLQLWDRPWSSTALKFATWALHRARRAGCDVLENPRVMESMEMVAAQGSEGAHFA